MKNISINIHLIFSFLPTNALCLSIDFRVAHYVARDNRRCFTMNSNRTSTVIKSTHKLPFFSSGRLINGHNRNNTRNQLDYEKFINKHHFVSFFDQHDDDHATHFSRYRIVFPVPIDIQQRVIKLWPGTSVFVLITKLRLFAPVIAV